MADPKKPDHPVDPQEDAPGKDKSDDKLIVTPPGGEPPPPPPPPPGG